MRKQTKNRKPVPPLPTLLSAGIVLGSIAVFALAERRRPLRRRREAVPIHVGRDIAIASLTSAITTAVQSRILRPLIRRLESERIGLLGATRLAPAIRVAAGVLLLDYTLWIWHWLNHHSSALWRFHRVHHVDLDLDTATGARFHFGEMSLSVFFRWLQLRVIGPDPLALSLWQTMLLASIFFHHSNTRLPARVEQTLGRVLATPRLHGIHHSVVQRETNSNFASLFTIWDQMHGLFDPEIDREDVTIGVPAYQDVASVTIDRVLVMPLRGTLQDWTIRSLSEADRGDDRPA